MRSMTAVTVVLVALFSGNLAAQEVKTTPKEEAAMRRQNEEFAKAHPPQQDSYKQTKQYQAQSAAEKAKTDAMVRATQKGIANIKKQDSAKCAPGKACASGAQ